MKTRICLLLSLLLLLSACERGNSSTLELRGAGYSTLSEVGGVCYLADTSGCVYTLDWDTGERTLAFQAPGDLFWTADPAMQYLYLIQDDTVCRMAPGDGQPETLCPVFLPETPLTNPALDCEILAVTDHYLLYWQHIWYDDPDEGRSYLYYVLCLDLSTLEHTIMLSPEDEPLSYLLCQEGDRVYVMIYDEVGMKLLNGANRLEVWDLETGEKAVLATLSQRNFPKQSVWSIAQNAAGFRDGILYYFDYPNARMYAVPADGSGEAEQLEVRGAELSTDMFLSADASVLAVQTEEPENEYRNKIVYHLYAYDPDADTAREITQFEDCYDIHALVTNGSRYAVFLDQSSSRSLVLGDIGP